MISLKRTIEDFDYRVMFEAAVGAYRSALEGLEKTAVRVEGDIFAEYRQRVLALQTGLTPQTLRPEMLRSHALDLNQELAGYQTNLESLLRDAGNDLKQVVGVLADAAESLSHREQIHGIELSRLSGSLEATSHLDNLPQMRGRLGQQILELRTCIDQMSRENETAVQSLQLEIAGFQKKLERVQIEASTDPLTGIANRRRAGKEIAARIRDGRAFGVLLLDLNRFKQINDTHGHGAGDCVLQIVTQRLTGHVRKDDLVSRWGGDEFLIVRSGGIEELAEHGRDLADRVAGIVSIDIEGQTHEIRIGMEVGWAAYSAGDSAEQLLAKADKSLYQTKVPREDRAAITKPEDLAAMSKPGRVAGMEELESEIRRAGAELGSWSVVCFAISHPAAIDAHYGYPASEQVLPLLQEEIFRSNFSKWIFRGRGACFFVLQMRPEDVENAEREMRRISAIAFEKALQQKRRQSVRPIKVASSLITFDKSRGASGAIQDLDRFTSLHKADEKLVTSVR